MCVLLDAIKQKLKEKLGINTNIAIGAVRGVLLVRNGGENLWVGNTNLWRDRVMDLMPCDNKWLIELLSYHRIIPIRDGLGTFLIRTKDGWTIRGVDILICLLDKQTFYDLPSALVAAKSIKKHFQRIQKQKKG